MHPFIQTITTLDQNLTHWAACLGWSVEGLLRMIVAAVAGGVVGIEREVRGRQAGLRTNALVALGSALAMIVSLSFAKNPWIKPSPDFNINIDPSRIAYSVMSGVGFLGAGVILHHRGTIRGLTTAAALWCVAALGLCAGFGLYLETLFAAVLILTVLWLVDYVEKFVPKRRFMRVTLRLDWTAGVLTRAGAIARKAGFGVHETTFKRRGDASRVDVHLRVSSSSFQKVERLIDVAEKEGGVQLLALDEVV